MERGRTGDMVRKFSSDGNPSALLREKCSNGVLTVASRRSRQRGFMADINRTQAEADVLIAMEKQRTDNRVLKFPDPGDRLTIPLISADRREAFTLDVTRGRIKFTKATYQDRARQAVILMRLDLDGPLHRNPDGEEIACPHLHIYRKDMATNGQCRLPPTSIRIPAICFQPSRRSCDTATLLRRSS
jgi:hypothetical protein